jgi:hypothetical protein
MRRAACAVLAVATALVASPAAPARVTGTAGFFPGGGKIVIAHNDGSHRRVLARGDLSWISPDGSRVAVMDWDRGQQGTHPRLKMLRAAGGPPAFVIRADLYPAVWSPDSTKLVAAVRDQRLVLIDATTGAVTTLATGSFGEKSFSPDSSKVAVLHYGNGPTQGGAALEVIDVATHSVQTIRRHVASPLWGPQAIAFADITRRHGNTVQNIATIQPDGTGFRRLTHIGPTTDFSGHFPQDWSADGRRLLTSFIGGTDALERAYGVDAVHGGAHLIARDFSPTALSRDGRFVIGNTGNPFCCSAAPVNVVRVPWRRDGKRRMLLHHAFSASYNG